MSTSRRHFLQYSLTAASMLALGSEALAGPDTKHPASAKHKLKILVLGGTSFLGPAFALLLIGLVYPTISTIYTSFLSNRGAFIGFDNYVWIFTQDQNWVVIRNTIIWVLVVPVLSTAIGLAYAVFIDRSRGEKFFKILVFLPMLAQPRLEQSRVSRGTRFSEPDA